MRISFSISAIYGCKEHLLRIIYMYFVLAEYYYFTEKTRSKLQFYEFGFYKILSVFPSTDNFD